MLNSPTERRKHRKNCLPRGSDGHGANGVVPLGRCHNGTELTVLAVAWLGPLGLTALARQQHGSVLCCARSQAPGFCTSLLGFPVCSSDCSSVSFCKKST